MSFVLASNLGTATTRMEDRRTASLNEATAISTARLQAIALDDPRGRAIATMLEEYLVIRRTVAASLPGSVESSQASESAAKLQSAIWNSMASRLSERADVQAVSLADALTHTFDMSTAQDFALVSGLPQRLPPYCGVFCQHSWRPATQQPASRWR